MGTGTTQPAYYFLRDGGETGALMRSYNWAATELGPADEWPEGLKLAVRSMLDSTVATSLFIGPTFVHLYNDAFIPTLGKTRHPIAMGKQVHTLAQRWDFIGPLLARAFGGEIIALKDQMLMLDKNGFPEACYMDLHYAPVYLTDGSIAGIRNILIETTEKVKAAQRLSASEAKFRSLIEQAPVATFLLAGPTLVIEIVNESMLTLLGRDRSIFGKTFDEALPELKDSAYPGILKEVLRSGKTREERAARADLVKNGLLTIGYYDYIYKPIINGAGEVYAIMCMAVDVTKQIFIQQELEKNQQEMLANFEQSPVGIAIISQENLTFTMANPFYGVLVGRQPDEIIGRPLLAALPELRGQGFDDLLRNVIATGVPFIAKEAPVEIQRNNRMETIYVDLIYQPRRENEVITGVLVVATDVTEQVLNRRVIEESELKFRTLIEEAPVATCVFFGRELRVEIANDLMLGFWGQTKEMLGSPLAEAVPELEGQPFLEILDNVFTSGITYEAKGASAVLRSNGVLGTYYFDFTYKPLRNSAGEVYAIMEMAVDVTAEILSRKKAADAEESLRGAIDLANLGTWSMDLETRLLDYDERLRSWFGFSKDEPITVERAYMPIAEGDRPLVKAAMAHALTYGTDGIYNVEYRLNNLQDHAERIVHAQGKTLFDMNNKAYQIRGTAQDVTIARRMEQELTRQVQQRTEELAASNEELQAVNEEINSTNEELAEANSSLQRSNAELEQFAYIASHDLQEPIRKISTFLQMLESSLGDVSERSRSYFEKISASTARMTSLIRDVLAYSQLSEVNEQYETMDLGQVFKEARSDFELLIQQKLALVKQRGLPRIEAIPLQMSQLFGNLLSNALKYSRQDVLPVIEISADLMSQEELAAYPTLERAKIYYKIRFSDNGIGIDPEQISRIFNIFQRLHGKTEYAGTGIGLSICKKIVQNHHGHIDAMSVKGHGTTFTIILPKHFRKNKG